MDDCIRTSRGTVLLSEAARRNQRLLDLFKVSNDKYTRRADSSSRFSKSRENETANRRKVTARPKSMYDIGTRFHMDSKKASNTAEFHREASDTEKDELILGRRGLKTAFSEHRDKSFEANEANIGLTREKSTGRIDLRSPDEVSFARIPGFYNKHKLHSCDEVHGTNSLSEKTSQQPNAIGKTNMTAPDIYQLDDNERRHSISGRLQLYLDAQEEYRRCVTPDYSHSLGFCTFTQSGAVVQSELGPERRRDNFDQLSTDVATKKHIETNRNSELNSAYAPQMEIRRKVSPYLLETDIQNNAVDRPKIKDSNSMETTDCEVNRGENSKIEHVDKFQPVDGSSNVELQERKDPGTILGDNSMLLIESVLSELRKFNKDQDTPNSETPESEELKRKEDNKEERGTECADPEKSQLKELKTKFDVVKSEKSSEEQIPGFAITDYKQAGDSSVQVSSLANGINSSFVPECTEEQPFVCSRTARNSELERNITRCSAEVVRLDPVMSYTFGLQSESLPAHKNVAIDATASESVGFASTSLQCEAPDANVATSKSRTIDGTPQETTLEKSFMKVSSLHETEEASMEKNDNVDSNAIYHCILKGDRVDHPAQKSSDREEISNILSGKRDFAESVALQEKKTVGKEQSSSAASMEHGIFVDKCTLPQVVTGSIPGCRKDNSSDTAYVLKGTLDEVSEIREKSPFAMTRSQSVNDIGRIVDEGLNAKRIQSFDESCHRKGKTNENFAGHSLEITPKSSKEIDFLDIDRYSNFELVPISVSNEELCPNGSEPVLERDEEYLEKDNVDSFDARFARLYWKIRQYSLGSLRSKADREQKLRSLSMSVDPETLARKFKRQWVPTEKKSTDSSLLLSSGISDAREILKVQSRIRNNMKLDSFHMESMKDSEIVGEKELVQEDIRNKELSKKGCENILRKAEPRSYKKHSTLEIEANCREHDNLDFDKEKIEYSIGTDRRRAISKHNEVIAEEEKNCENPQESGIELYQENSGEDMISHRRKIRDRVRKRNDITGDGEECITSQGRRVSEEDLNLTNNDNADENSIKHRKKSEVSDEIESVARGEDQINELEAGKNVKEEILRENKDDYSIKSRRRRSRMLEDYETNVKDTGSEEVNQVDRYRDMIESDSKITRRSRSSRVTSEAEELIIEKKNEDYIREKEQCPGKEDYGKGLERRSRKVSIESIKKTQTENFKGPEDGGDMEPSSMCSQQLEEHDNKWKRRKGGVEEHDQFEVEMHSQNDESKTVKGRITQEEKQTKIEELQANEIESRTRSETVKAYHANKTRNKSRDRSVADAEIKEYQAETMLQMESEDRTIATKTTDQVCQREQQKIIAGKEPEDYNSEDEVTSSNFDKYYENKQTEDDRTVHNKGLEVSIKEEPESYKRLHSSVDHCEENSVAKRKIPDDKNLKTKDDRDEMKETEDTWNGQPRRFIETIAENNLREGNRKDLDTNSDQDLMISTESNLDIGEGYSLCRRAGLFTFVETNINNNDKKENWQFSNDSGNLVKSSEKMIEEYEGSAAGYRKRLRRSRYMEMCSDDEKWNASIVPYSKVVSDEDDRASNICSSPSIFEKRNKIKLVDNDEERSNKVGILTEEEASEDLKRQRESLSSAGEYQREGDKAAEEKSVSSASCTENETNCSGETSDGGKLAESYRRRFRRSRFFEVNDEAEQATDDSQCANPDRDENPAWNEQEAAGNEELIGSYRRRLRRSRCFEVNIEDGRKQTERESTNEINCESVGSAKQDIFDSRNLTESCRRRLRRSGCFDTGSEDEICKDRHYDVFMNKDENRNVHKLETVVGDEELTDGNRRQSRRLRTFEIEAADDEQTEKQHKVAQDENSKALERQYVKNDKVPESSRRKLRRWRYFETGSEDGGREDGGREDKMQESSMNDNGASKEDDTQFVKNAELTEHYRERFKGSSELITNNEDKPAMEGRQEANIEKDETSLDNKLVASVSLESNKDYKSRLRRSMHFDASSEENLKIDEKVNLNEAESKGEEPDTTRMYRRRIAGRQLYRRSMGSDNAGFCAMDGLENSIEEPLSAPLSNEECKKGSDLVSCSNKSEECTIQRGNGTQFVYVEEGKKNEIGKGDIREGDIVNSEGRNDYEKETNNFEESFSDSNMNRFRKAQDSGINYEDERREEVHMSIDKEKTNLERHETDEEVFNERQRSPLRSLRRSEAASGHECRSEERNKRDIMNKELEISNEEVGDGEELTTSYRRRSRRLDYLESSTEEDKDINKEEIRMKAVIDESIEKKDCFVSEHKGSSYHFDSCTENSEREKMSEESSSVEKTQSGSRDGAQREEIPFRSCRRLGHLQSNAEYIEGTDETEYLHSQGRARYCTGDKEEGISRRSRRRRSWMLEKEYKDKKEKEYKEPSCDEKNEELDRNDVLFPEIQTTAKDDKQKGEGKDFFASLKDATGQLDYETLPGEILNCNIEDGCKSNATEKSKLPEGRTLSTNFDEFTESCINKGENSQRYGGAKWNSDTQIVTNMSASFRRAVTGEEFHPPPSVDSSGVEQDQKQIVTGLLKTADTFSSQIAPLTERTNERIADTGSMPGADLGIAMHCHDERGQWAHEAVVLGKSSEASGGKILVENTKEQVGKKHEGWDFTDTKKVESQASSSSLTTDKTIRERIDSVDGKLEHINEMQTDEKVTSTDEDSCDGYYINHIEDPLSGSIIRGEYVTFEDYESRDRYAIGMPNQTRTSNSTEVDSFESKMHKIKAKMRRLVDRNIEMEERIEYGGRETVCEDKQWEYFLKQNKLLQLAVSKLWQKEGFDSSRLIKDQENSVYMTGYGSYRKW